MSEREPSEQDYQWAATVKGEVPQPEPDADDEPSPDYLGDEIAMREDEGDDEGSDPEPEMPVRSLDVMQIQAEISSLQTRARYLRDSAEQTKNVPSFTAGYRQQAEELERQIAELRAKLPPDPSSPAAVAKKSGPGRPQKHGFARHPIYKAWDNMHQRCFNPRHKDYRLYGQIGVTVCAEWLAVKYGGQPGGFERFLVDMFTTWKSGLKLGRRGDVGNYCAANCVWQTATASNRTKARKARKATAS